MTGNDIESALPIRSKQDVDERVLVKLVDAADPAGVDKQMEISEKKAHVRNFSKDSDGNDQQVLLSQEGHTQSNGDYDASLNKRPSSQGLILHDRKNTAELPAEADQNKRPTAVAYDNGVDETVVAQDVAIRDEDGVPYSKTNPLPVSIEESEGDEIHSYFESVSAITKNNTDTHEYIVSALKELELEQWSISASGLMKGTLRVETGVGTGIFNIVDVLFNSTANPNAIKEFKRPIKVAAGVKVQVVRLQADNQAQGMYSTINGLES